MDGSSVVTLGLIGSIVGLTLVFDISDVSRVGIGNAVGHNLGAAIGKSHAVLASGSITITVLVLGKVGARVVISNSIAVSVDSGTIISGLGMVSGSVVSGLVSGSGVSDGLVSGSGVNDGSGLVDGGGLVVSGGGGGVVDGSGLVVDGSGLVVSGGGVVDGSGVVDGGGMVGKVVLGGMDGDVGGGVDTGDVLLLVVVLVDLIGGGGGLGDDGGVVGAMRFVDGGGDGWGVTVLDALVAVLVGQSQSQEGGESDESL
jgi:hypothetical protein